MSQPDPRAVRPATRAVRPATRADRETIARVFSAAFADDPLMTWIFRHPRRRPNALRRLFRMEVDGFLKDGEVSVNEAGTAAATWLPPGVHESPSVLALLRNLPSFLAAVGPLHATRVIRAFAISERAKPEQPFYFLGTLGVEPASQGQGLGSAMIDAMTPRIDAESMPAYLLSSNARNLPLYERHGFRVTEALQLPWDGPMLWPMYRERVS